MIRLPTTLCSSSCKNQWHTVQLLRHLPMLQSFHVPGSRLLCVGGKTLFDRLLQGQAESMLLKHACMLARDLLAMATHKILALLHKTLPRSRLNCHRTDHLFCPAQAVGPAEGSWQIGRRGFRFLKSNGQRVCARKPPSLLRSNRRTSRTSHLPPDCSSSCTRTLHVEQTEQNMWHMHLQECLLPTLDQVLRPLKTV